MYNVKQATPFRQLVARNRLEKRFQETRTVIADYTLPSDGQPDVSLLSGCHVPPYRAGVTQYSLSIIISLSV